MEQTINVGDIVTRKNCDSSYAGITGEVLQIDNTVSDGQIRASVQWNGRSILSDKPGKRTWILIKNLKLASEGENSNV
jgi:hypothetical protein